MATARITREELVEQSVSDYVRNAIFNVKGYPTSMVSFLDAFQEGQFTGPLDRSYVAVGFNFDSGGTFLELGSDLMERTYTIEFWIIGHKPEAGRNLANAVRDVVEGDALIPLKDYRQAGAPVIDQLMVDVEDVRAARQPIAEPRPWEENLWIVHVPITDVYYASLT